MKYVLLLAAIIVLIQMMSVEGKKKIFKDCAKELKISKEMIKEARESNNYDKPELKCLAACVMKKSGKLETGNKFNMDIYKEYVTKHYPTKVDELIKENRECLDAAKSITDECEFANSIHKCMSKKFPDLKKAKGA